MNRLSDIIEMGGNLYEEAWNNGRREALREIQGGKYEKLEETNRALRGQIYSYEKTRLTQDEEIHQMKDALNRTGIEIGTLRGQLDGYDSVNAAQAKKIRELEEQVHQLDAENGLLNKTVENLRKKLEDAEAKIKEPTPRACPFCGGPAEVHQLHKDEWYVACGNNNCPVNPETSCFDTETDAIEAWNNSYDVPKVTCDWR